jgi:hypothetical protein
MRRPLANALDIDLRGGLTDAVTPHAGSALLIDLGRGSGVIAAADKHLPQKKSLRGLGQGQCVESVVVLSALGGDCLDDFDGLRRDRGLATLLGYDLPAASTARQWLDRFHDETLLAERPVQGSFIPPESAALAGLRAVGQHSVRTYVSAVSPGPGGHAGRGCASGRVRQAQRVADLRGLPRLPAAAGLLGRDRAGAGRRVPRRQRPGLPRHP